MLSLVPCRSGWSAMLPRAMFVDIRAELWLGTVDGSMTLLLWGHWKLCDYSWSLLTPRTILGSRDHANAGIRQIWKACAATRVHGDVWAQAVSPDLIWICGPATVGLWVDVPLFLLQQRLTRTICWIMLRSTRALLSWPRLSLTQSEPSPLRAQRELLPSPES